jgi:hypothetical protein
VSAIIHTESAIFTEGIFGGEVRVDLEIEDLGATRIWRYTVTNLSFAPPNRSGFLVDIGVFYIGLFPVSPGMEPGLADDVTAPPGWGFVKNAFSSESLWFGVWFDGSVWGDGLDIGESGLFTFSEVKYVEWSRFPYTPPTILGPHEITHLGWLALGDFEPIVEPYIGFLLLGSISTPGPRQVVLPEPSTLCLSVVGLAALAAVRGRRRRG